MSDDKTQEMPVMADAGDMLPKRCIPWMRSPRMTSRSAVGVQRR